MHAPHSHQAVADFVADLVSDLAVEIQGQVRAQPTAMQRAFHDLHTRVAAAVGTPSATIGGLIDWVRLATERVYLPVAPGINGRLAQLRVLISHSAGPPSDCLPPCLATAVTQFPVGGGPAWRVKLTIAAPPDEATWNALPYVLLHEFVSHGAQGPWTAACRPPDEDSYFAEGWMDGVVMILHDQLVKGWFDHLGVEALPRPMENWATAHQLYGLRRDQLDGAPRLYGYQIAEALHLRLQQAAADDVPNELFLRLSLELNVSARTNRERDLFVAGIGRALRETAGQAEASFADYVRTADSANLIDRAISRARS